MDARGFAYSGFSPVSFGSNPFADPTDPNGVTVTTKNVILLLPSVTIMVNSPIGVPKQSVLRGAGSLNTTLKMGSNFPTPSSGNCDSSGNTRCYPVICQGVENAATSGSGGHNSTGTLQLVSAGSPPVISCETPAGSGNPAISNSPRSQIESLGVDLAGTPYGVAIANSTGQEKSWIRNFQIAGIANGGRGVTESRIGCQGHGGACGNTQPGDPNEVQNSGPVTDAEINWTGTDCSGTTFPNSTYGIYVQNGPSVTMGVGGHITLNGSNCSQGTATNKLIAIEAGGNAVDIENIHCEKWYDCVKLGEKAGVNGGTVKNISTANNGPVNAVDISNNNSVVATISSLQVDAGGGTNFITDGNSGCFGSTPCIISGSGGLAQYIAGTGHIAWVQGPEEHPSGNINLEAGNALTNGSTTAGTYLAGDLACWTGLNTVGSCPSASANAQTIGVLEAKNGVAPVYATIGQVNANSQSPTASFTQGDYVCADSVNAGKVVDNSTVPCPPGNRYIGVVAASDSMTASHLITLNLGPSLPPPPAGGSNTQVQFNSSGALAGAANLTWDNSANALAVTGSISQAGNYTNTYQAGLTITNYTATQSQSSDLILKNTLGSPHSMGMLEYDFGGNAGLNIFGTTAENLVRVDDQLPTSFTRGVQLNSNGTGTQSSDLIFSQTNGHSLGMLSYDSTNPGLNVFGNEAQTIARFDDVLPTAFNNGVTVAKTLAFSILNVTASANGTMIYCSNCKNAVDDAITAPAACASAEVPARWRGAKMATGIATESHPEADALATIS